MTFDPTPPSHQPRSQPRLLVVEPNRSALTVMATRLGEAGYRIIACDNPINAPAEMHRAGFDLVLAELRMAPLSGVELTRLIRDDTALKATPVILITGKSDSAGAVDGFAAGADDVVAKPFHFEVLVARIARRIARAQSERVARLQATLSASVTRAIPRRMRAALEASEARGSGLEGSSAALNPVRILFDRGARSPRPSATAILAKIAALSPHHDGRHRPERKRLVPIISSSRRQLDFVPPRRVFPRRECLTASVGLRPTMPSRDAHASGRLFDQPRTRPLPCSRPRMMPYLPFFFRRHFLPHRFPPISA